MVHATNVYGQTKWVPEKESYSNGWIGKRWKGWGGRDEGWDGVGEGRE